MRRCRKGKTPSSTPPSPSAAAAAPAPSRPKPLPPEARLKALAALARAGFPRGVAETALDMAPEEAEGRLATLRQG